MLREAWALAQHVRSFFSVLHDKHTTRMTMPSSKVGLKLAFARGGLPRWAARVARCRVLHSHRHNIHGTWRRFRRRSCNSDKPRQPHEVVAQGIGASQKPDLI